jgi:hypothetical protein
MRTVSEFLWVIAIGVPVSTAVCVAHAAIRRRVDVVQGGLPVLAVTAIFGLLMIALFK